jgi:hypothetical protein
MKKPRKKMYKVFGKTENETFGNFYTFFSTSRKGAEQHARRKYSLKILK